tara:strand:+ start:279 stop:1193 length:915 start_codon:yes stop_codon:yes gene_type:complete
LDWVTIALLGSAVSGIVNIFDKTVIYKYANTPRTLPLMIGIAQSTVGLVLLAIVQIPISATMEFVLWALLSGMLWGLSAQFLMHVLFTEEVSRTVPVFQSFPIFTAIFAFFILGESLNILQWGAILAVVVGATLISVKIDVKNRKALLNKSLAILMVGSAIQGSAHVFGKVAVDELPVLFTHSIRSLGLGIIFLLFNLRQEPLNDLRNLIQQRSPAFIISGTNEFFIATLSLVLSLWALSLGPAALVTALTSTRSFFLVVYSLIIGLIWKGALGEITTASSVATKLVATSIIVIGVSIISLGNN